MSRYDQLNVYDFERPGVVSIWVATVPLSRIPKNYLKENGDNEDGPFNRFSADFGFAGGYDHDTVDTNASPGRAKSIADLLGECSYSSSFVGRAAAEAKKRGLDKTQFVFLLYDARYPARRTKITKSEFMEFLGCFPYDDEAPNAVSHEDDE